MIDYATHPSLRVCVCGNDVRARAHLNASCELILCALGIMFDIWCVKEIT